MTGSIDELGVIVSADRTIHNATIINQRIDDNNECSSLNGFMPIYDNEISNVKSTGDNYIL